jgi:1-acyl-sn-glycerol-3-phosphate acyltransferase
MELVKTVAAFMITVASMILFIPVGCMVLLFSFLGLGKPMAFIMYKMAQFWARLLITIAGCPMNVSGRENIPQKGGVCFVSNHVGMLDIILALGYAGRPFGFIAKKELLFIPGVNIWILILGGLFIDRKKPRKALATINRGIKNIKRGGGMLIFPEGTRSRGQGLAVFHPGSLKLATQSGAIIVPVAITGSYEVFEKSGRVRAAPVFLSFLQPIYPEELPPEDRKQMLSDRIHDSIAAELERHTRAAPGAEP